MNGLRDVVITISEVELDDDNQPFAVTRVYRYDLEGPVEAFIGYVECCNGIIEGSQMKND